MAPGRRGGRRRGTLIAMGLAVAPTAQMACPGATPSASWARARAVSPDRAVDDRVGLDPSASATTRVAVGGGVAVAICAKIDVGEPVSRQAVTSGLGERRARASYRAGRRRSGPSIETGNPVSTQARSVSRHDCRPVRAGLSRCPSARRPRHSELGASKVRRAPRGAAAVTARRRRRSRPCGALACREPLDAGSTMHGRRSRRVVGGDRSRARRISSGQSRDTICVCRGVTRTRCCRGRAAGP